MKSIKEDVVYVIENVTYHETDRCVAQVLDFEVDYGFIEPSVLPMLWGETIIDNVREDLT